MKNNNMTQIFQITAILCLSTIPVFAQTAEKHFQLFDLNSHWNQVQSFARFPIEDNPFIYNKLEQTFTYFFNGDTTIQDQTYQKIYRTTQENIDLNDPANEYYGGWREEGDKIYFNAKFFTGEVLLYDFDIKVGDTLTVEEFNIDYPRGVKVYLENIDSTETLDGQLRKRYNFHIQRSFDIPTYFTSWIEGIGQIGSGGFLNTHLDGSIYSPSYSIYAMDSFGEHFQCFSKGDALIYQNDSQTSCYIRTTDEFAPIGATWKYGYENNTAEGKRTGFITVKAVRDTMLNSVRQGTVLSIESLDFSIAEKQKFIISQSREKVYYYESGTFHLLYDFALTTGDTFAIRYPFEISQQYDQDTIVTFVIDSIGSIQINDETRKVQYVRNITDNSFTQYGTTIIEGIGGLESWLLPYQACENCNEVSIITGLRCYEDDFLGQWQFSDTPCDLESYTNIRRPYEPLVVENATWFLASNTDVYAESVNYFAYKIVGDSMVNEVFYKKLFRYELALISGGTYELKSQALQLLVREDTSLRKVYGYPTTNLDGTTTNEEFLMIDFAKTVGQSITYFDFNEGITKTSRIIEDVVELWFNEERRTLKTADGILFFEGIGYYSGLLEIPSPIVLPTGEVPVVASYCVGINFECNILTATKEPLPQKVNIFPNPANDFLSLQFEQIFNGQIELHSLAGQVVYQTEFQATTHEINMADLPKGIYFLHLQAEEGYLVRKVVVQ